MALRGLPEIAPALDPVVCERARQARDPRFDGRFFVGVRTTGIYCRPICPVRLPRAENVRFFASAAAAAEAGFRPCLRCRPESSPGTSAWAGTASTVARALRLIHDGALDASGVDALAARLGIGARHLDRLFRRHLGATPVRVAQTRRLHLAKTLLDETRLPLVEIAHAAGFGSVRRFNEAVRASFGRSPGALRAAVSARSDARVSGGAGRAGALRVRLAYRPPLDREALLDFFAARAIPGVEAVAGGTYRRALAVDGQAGTIAISPVPGAHALELVLDFGDLATVLVRVIGRVRAAFDLDADPLAIEAVLARDPALAPRLRARPGLRVPGAFDGFECAVRAVLGQQVSVAGARTLAGRLAARFGRALPAATDTGPCRLFPTPDALAGADIAAIGLPAARAETIRRLAQEVSEGRLDLETPRDLDAVVEALRRVPGIGDWTAQYVALRALREPDAFPASDLGLRAGAALCFGDATRRPGAAELERRAERWRPWRAYAAQHLWTAWAERARTAAPCATATPDRVRPSRAPRSARASAPSTRS